MADEKHAKAAPETGLPAQKDRVAMVTLNVDGSPKQTPDFEFVGDPDVAKEAAGEQFRQYAVSAEDERVRRELADKGEMGFGGNRGDDGNEMDAPVQKVADAHKKAEDAATKHAESLVDARHPDAHKK